MPIWSKCSPSILTQRVWILQKSKNAVAKKLVEKNKKKSRMAHLKKKKIEKNEKEAASFSYV